SPVLHGFPYHLFGISPAQVIELLTRQPAEASALVNALFAIAEQYNIGVEHLYRSALRSYQELNDNYFPEIERAVDEFAKSSNLKSGPTPSIAELSSLIESRFAYRLDGAKLARHKKLAGFRSVLISRPREGPLLLINPGLTELQRKFVLAREIGYQVLNLRERAMTSAPERVDSFEQVLNDFKASYFAGAILINRELLLADLKKFFALERWKPDRLRALLDRYEVTPEVLMYRLTELLPRYFGIKLHFLRFNHENGEYRLVKHLNMSQVLIPGGAGVNEHHCRRWLAIRVLSKLEAENNGYSASEPLIDAQLSRFVDNQSRYLCIAMARRLTLKPSATSSVSVGFRFEKGFERTVRFANDPKITRLDIDGTCERCRFSSEQCTDRAAPPVLFELQ